MRTYIKNILSLQQQINSYSSAGMTIQNLTEAEDALKTIGYYRLRGYCYPFYNNQTKKYVPGTDFSTILSIYQFDLHLSQLLFGMTTKIEVSLRAHLIDALLIHNDVLILMDPEIFNDKATYWKNLSIICSEVSRASDVFINHNFNQHAGHIPIWASVEIMSFGTLSKTIKNLKTGPSSSFDKLVSNYTFTSSNGNTVRPSMKMFSSWIHAVTVLRNICAHNGRIYNRAISVRPQLISSDQQTPAPTYSGLYQILLAMKYLRPTNQVWNDFRVELENLLAKYSSNININSLNLPPDWKNHLMV